MDILITSSDEKLETNLSGLGLEVFNVEISPPSLEMDYRKVSGRSGRISHGGRYEAKKIKVSGWYTVADQKANRKLLERLYGLLIDKDGYYLTEMMAVSDAYSFEVAGQTTGEIDFSKRHHEPCDYRYHVVCVDGIETDFKGKSAIGLTFSFQLKFETDRLPFGETKPVDLDVIRSVDYKGTAPLSQLEVPWVLELTSTTSQKGDFYVRIGNHRFEHKSLTAINSGDVFKISAMETWALHQGANYENVTQWTNYEYFELLPGVNQIQTNFSGTIRILGYQELFK